MLPSATYDPTGISYYSISSHRFNAGVHLPVRIAYRSFNPTLSKTVCVPTSEHGHINTTLNFTAGALKNYHVVVVAMLGNGESSSPSNTANFPQPLYQDSINAYHKLFTKHLNVHQLEAVIGYGMGGQQVYYWLCMQPGFIKRAVVICGSARTSPYNYMLLDGIEAALISSAGFAKERSSRQGSEPEGGLHAYGKVICAWWTSTAWFNDKMFMDMLGFETIQEFMEKWDRSFDSWNAADLLGLVKMWQFGDIGALRADKDYTKALEDIEARVLVIASATDYFFSLQDAEVEINHLKRGELVVMNTVWGHAAGSGASVVDAICMDKAIAEFLGRSC
ncbi:Homoserine O-acetyltransferase [Hyphodiscus hymeniophilus]|uniref:Homoserine O-acetyltransferase n=1 Tax=Hyphodiscus hymeniophilus TaxID=353542 RepID=A0A9P6VQV0_9HELO|nr:Homoserine O-acetyltransferase [Hyphodiscus hymeniophilus]